MALLKMFLRDLRPADLFTFKKSGSNGFIMSSIRPVSSGVDTFFIRYSSAKRWRSWESIKRGSTVVYVPRIGRFY